MVLAVNEPFLLAADENESGPELKEKRIFFSLFFCFFTLENSMQGIQPLRRRYSTSLERASTEMGGGGGGGRRASRTS